MRGAWIEIAPAEGGFPVGSRRSPCGERGLKLVLMMLVSVMLGRSPCGERGLKSQMMTYLAIRNGRSPCGERGLKSDKSVSTGGKLIVAPHAGSVD